MNQYKTQNDEVQFDNRQFSRWQKYGNDRIYLTGDKDGYIDIKEGEVKREFVENLKTHPITDVNVEVGDDWVVVKGEILGHEKNGGDEEELVKISTDIWGN